MVIEKLSGVTNTERALADLCEQTFLKLWSYPNPSKDDGHELCDLLAVFGKHVFVFFDRQCQLPEVSDREPQVLWDRWKRNVINQQVNTAHGAERYIRSGRPIFLDAKRTEPFPLIFDAQNAVIHKIIIAHGALDACEKASEKNVYGSLAITYCESEGGSTQPFHVEIDKRNPVHIFDTHNLPIVLAELDTVQDFSNYLDAKLKAVEKFDSLTYCGEEDLLGHYLLNFDQTTKQHIIGTKRDDINGVMIGEGEWHDFIETPVYKNTKNENNISYFWDELIQRTCQNALNGTLGGNSDLPRGPSAIFEMAREPRFIRRALADTIRHAVLNFPDHPNQLTRQVTLLPSFRTDVAYVFFQLRVPNEARTDPDYLDKRRTLLEIACGAARNKLPHLTKVIGIGMGAPRYAGNTNSEDFILLSCDTWTNETREHYEEQNRDWSFFGTPQLEQFNMHVTQFVQP